LSSSYFTWLERQEELAKKAQELIQSFKFEAVLIREEKGKPPFVRMILGTKRIDFMLKEIKSRFVKQVWLCKKGIFNPKKNFLVFSAKEEKWLITTGSEVDKKGEYKDSDYHKDTEMVVIPVEILRPAKRFLKSLKIRYEEQKQRRITNWTQPKVI